MSKSKRRVRDQQPKSSRVDYVRGMQDLRRSNATSPIPSGTKYKRAKAGARGRDW